MAKDDPKAAQAVAVNVGEVVTLTASDPATGATAEVQLAVAKITVPDQPIPPDPIPPDPGGLTEKVYTPEQFGDFTALGKAIIADQVAAGDGKTRAVIQFESGKRYEYPDNHWLTGVQNYRCEAVGSGAKPQLRCTNSGAGLWIDRGPLNAGKGANCFAEHNAPMSKTKAMALIATVGSGSSVVKLLTASDAAKLKPGRWHAVFSYCQQIGGYPPNVRWIDYAIVESVEGTTVNLDRQLAHSHFADYWEDPNDVQSVGKARIGLWDGAYDDIRCTLDGHWKGIEFIGEGQAGMDVTYIESHIKALFEDCKISNFWVSMCKGAELRNCSLSGAGNQAAEPDKLTETLTLDGCTTPDRGKYLQGCTGLGEVIVKNSNLNCTVISPRKLTVTDTVFDTHADTYFYVPINWAYNGPILDVSFTGVTFAANTPAQATWTYSKTPVAPLPLSAGSWSGNKLIIPRSFGGFESWLVWLYEGIMVFTGARVFNPGNYGRVDKIYAPADGSALWCDVVWIKGTKPTSGNLNIPQNGLRKLVWGAGTKVAPGSWIEPDFVSMTGTPADRAFPQGIS